MHKTLLYSLSILVDFVVLFGVVAECLFSGSNVRLELSNNTVKALFFANTSTLKKIQNEMSCSQIFTAAEMDEKCCMSNDAKFFSHTHR